MEKRVLFAVLDWGLGHATRSVPIMRSILKHGVSLEISTRGKAEEYLKTHFPSQLFHALPDQPVRYAERGAGWALAKRAVLQPAINQKQHKKIYVLARERKVTHIVSDNVYGAYHEELKCALITHQLSLRSPALSKQVNQKLANWINRFDEVWIPDDPAATLAGKLSENNQVTTKTHHLGVLSQTPRVDSAKSDYEIGVILSGPEPQRSILEKKLMSILYDLDRKSIVFRGVFGQGQRVDGPVTVKDFGSPKEMAKDLHNTELLISRSGYSSVMDFMEIGKRKLFVPTPGQTEQEYLAKMLVKYPGVFSIAQANLTVEKVKKLLSQPVESAFSARRFEEDSKVITDFLGL
jgi:predicted glycosyltransferase